VLIPLGIAMVLLAVFWPQNKDNGYSATVIDRLTEVRNARDTNYGSCASAAFDLVFCLALLVEDHPWLGKGWGCFELFYPFYQGSQLLLPQFRNLRTHANNAHNEILEYWSQIGTLGLGLILLFGFFIFVRLHP